VEYYFRKGTEAGYTIVWPSELRLSTLLQKTQPCQFYNLRCQLTNLRCNTYGYGYA
jgi:hypothetical protein